MKDKQGRWGTLTLVLTAVLLVVVETFIRGIHWVSTGNFWVETYGQINRLRIFLVIITWIILWFMFEYYD
jgi:uncharacterized BrkB/YihY/UPF0761 family membrane protein